MKNNGGCAIYRALFDGHEDFIPHYANREYLRGSAGAYRCHIHRMPLDAMSQLPDMPRQDLFLAQRMNRRCAGVHADQDPVRSVDGINRRCTPPEHHTAVIAQVLTVFPLTDYSRHCLARSGIPVSACFYQSSAHFTPSQLWKESF